MVFRKQDLLKIIEISNSELGIDEKIISIKQCIESMIPDIQIDFYKKEGVQYKTSNGEWLSMVSVDNLMIPYSGCCTSVVQVPIQYLMDIKIKI